LSSFDVSRTVTGLAGSSDEGIASEHDHKKYSEFSFFQGVEACISNIKVIRLCLWAISSTQERL
jgi:hypothetical protein